MTAERDLGVALSGGGHRATAFGLGALLALADTGLNRSTVSISSVSGGSIANGIVMVGPDFGTSDGPAVAAHLAPALQRIATRGILLGGAPATAGYLRSLIGAVGIAAVSFVLALVGLIAHWWAVGLGALVIGLGVGRVAWQLLGQRSARTERAIDDELLGGAGITLAALRAQPSSVHHVVCTTELQTGTSFFFTNRAVYGHQCGGTTVAPDLALATAVQASACVPGAFTPRVISLRSLGLGDGGDIVVDDGGVYDNMADEWEYGFGNRARNNWPEVLEVQPGPARTLVVVNGSAGWNDKKPIAGRGIGLELAGLLRAKDVQYDVSTAHRRRALFQEFADRDDDHPGLAAGVFAQITASPYDTVTQFAGRPGWTPNARTERAAEARAFLDRHEYSEAWWTSTVAENSGVGTTLAPLGAGPTARLLEHGYVLTLVNLFVILGLGALPATFDRDRFRRLVAGQST